MYFYTLILIVCLKTNISGKIQYRNRHMRVHYGEDIKEGEYPYAVSLLRKYKVGSKNYISRFCTASVIAEHWTLTAAHCVEDEKAKDVFVWYGNHTVSPIVTKLYTKVLNILIHQAYQSFSYSNSEHLDNDISLLRTHKITLKYYGSISAADTTAMIGLPVTYVGSGDTNKPGSDEMRPLQVGEAIISKCDSSLKDIGKHVICISSRCSAKKQRPWYGDSGGPLVCDGKIVGVLSFGDSDIVEDAYTPTSPYIGWLYDVMHSKN